MSEAVTARVDAAPRNSFFAQMLTALLDRSLNEARKGLHPDIERLSDWARTTSMDPTTPVRLLTLHRALERESASPLYQETMRHLARETKAITDRLGQALTEPTRELPSPREMDAALSAMIGAARTAQMEIAHRAQEQMARDVQSVLQERGYAVHVKKDVTTSRYLIGAKKGEQVAAARIDADGFLELDLAGFDRGVCTEERMAIMQGLATRDYAFTIQARTVHNRRTGGDIVKAIEREFQEIDEHFRRLCLARAVHKQTTRS